jgi:hypothetical protein
VLSHSAEYNIPTNIQAHHNQVYQQENKTEDTKDFIQLFENDQYHMIETVI